MPATHLSRHVRDAHCLATLVGRTPEAVVTEISQAFVTSGAISEPVRKSLVKTVLQREGRATTGIGNGVALPHPTAPEDVRGQLTELLVGVGISQAGIPFQDVDGAPVHAVFLVASPDPQEYLAVARLVAGLARDRNWPRLIKQCKTSREIRELVEEAWAGVGG
jgi:mannitol/fructose-specific phosphotransferase system IIA component (Ntr-type)